MPASKKQSHAFPKVTREDLQFQIQQLRLDKILFAIEGLFVVAFSLVASSALPDLIYRYMYDSGKSERVVNIEMLTMIPVIFNVVALVFGTFVIVSNVLRYKKMRMLENELAQLEK
ncbi:MAG: hypothetical protein UX04_C0001G0109 [Microgenomates group bacterium GW2011_GWF2_45_18]|nr:MAG: hypothetical protein UW18_C0003G0121 [Microgenomates group bacterium GW2011_GWF1_44_10]KKU02338.1 MAG: hypothetical protein UX04_C0001G0109 [Microgenomates group bacterium GW2011_GWF2_45_18]OGJ41670.1 MAG: hypothetical protein A2378_02195 [Candidatus Pacebacteria bacterium RIFOXYB1_FULL_44_10]HAU99195.1 hypothetical protein [Candidatus Paceibacterota bacterium]HAX01725.1 hypothetical protein [Candidatus Paceibacterota bacterium]